MKPTDADDRRLLCVRDNTTVPADAPECLHPSSFCEFREFCQVVEAARQKRRSTDEEAQ